MPKIVSERNLTVAEVERILEEMSTKRDLSSIENLTLDYARKFKKIEYEKAVKLKEILKEKFDIPEEYAVQIVNIMPESTGEIRMILNPLNKIFTEEQLKEIKNILDEYRE